MVWDNVLELRPLMELNIQLADGWDVGVGPFGARKVFGAKSGDFKFLAQDLLGLDGKVVPGPADFSCTYRDSDRTKDILEIDVRALLETNGPNPQRFIIRYTNWIKFGTDLLGKLYAGDKISYDVSEFIIQPRFQTGLTDSATPPNRLERLNTTIGLGHAELSDQLIRYRFYEARAPGQP